MIGLLTPYTVNNYGTKLQAYAVQEIMSQFDTVEIIRYIPNIHDRVKGKLIRIYYHTSAFTDIVCDQTDKKLDPALESQRKTAISSFDSRLKFSPAIKGRKKLSQKCRDYAAVVCGSDQIWNPVNLGMQIYMLEFVPQSVRRIALAPSFGVDRIPDNLMGQYRKRISRIEYVSVREESGCRLARELGAKNPFWSLDPTLILDKARWSELAEQGKHRIPEPYIFCYFLGIHSFGRDLAEKLKKETGCRIVNLPHFKTYVERDEHFADIDLYDVDPADFISLIKNAAYVVTDSFHGTAFSVIFKRSFYCVERHQRTTKGNTNDRLHSFLRLIGQSGRMIRDGLESVDPDVGIDWQETDLILAEKRKACIDFLKNAVAGERND